MNRTAQRGHHPLHPKFTMPRILLREFPLSTKPGQRGLEYFGPLPGVSVATLAWPSWAQSLHLFGD